MEAPVARLDIEVRVLLDETIDFVCKNNTARSISELSHTRAWEVASMGEVMPYHSAMNIVPVEVEPSDVDWAIEEASKLANAKSRGAPVQRRSYREFRESVRGH